VLAAVWWVFDKRTAQQTATLAVASDLHYVEKEGACLAVTLLEVRTGIAAAADRLRFRLTDHAVVLARVRAATAVLDDKLASVKTPGSWVSSTKNSSVGGWRRSAPARGSSITVQRGRG
jgi:hypothetical protein